MLCKTKQETEATNALVEFEMPQRIYNDAKGSNTSSVEVGKCVNLD